MKNIAIGFLLGAIVAWGALSFMHPAEAPVDDVSIMPSDELEEEQALAPHSNITVDNATSGMMIQSPYSFSGEARLWYFEGDFPVFVVDNQNNQLGVGIATAQSDWMVETPVPFTGSVTFVVPPGVTNGELVFQKDNPSGNAQFDDEYRIPVTF